MPSNTSTSVQSNETFSTGGPVSLAVGVLSAAAWNTGVGMNYAEMTTEVAGSPASFTVLLEGSVDGGSTWAIVATTTNTAGETQYTTGLVPFLTLRARCSAVSGGTSPTINVVVTASQSPFVRTQGGTTPSQDVAVVGSVDTTQVLNEYSSVAAHGIATTPTAGTAIATLALFNFYYRVDVTVGFGAAAESVAADNFELLNNGTLVAVLMVPNAVNGQSPTYTFFVNPGGSVNVTVNAVATASAGAVYKASIIATRLL